MALKRSLEKAEHAALAADLKSEYIERDGKFVLNVDGEMPALEAERQARKALEDKLKGYGDLTPEQVKALNDAKTAAERDAAFKSGNFEKILAQTEEKHAKDMALRDANDKKLLASLEAALIGEEAVRAITEHGGNPTLLMPIIKARAKLEVAGDKHVAVIIGEKGGPLLKAGAQKADDFMGMSEFVGSLKADKQFAGAFTSPAGSGSGGTRNGVTRPSSQATNRAATVDRIAKSIMDGATTLSE